MSRAEELRKDRARRRYFVAGACILAALGVAALAVYAWRARGDAERARAFAEESGRIASRNAVEATTERDKATKALAASKVAEDGARVQQGIAVHQAEVATGEAQCPERARPSSATGGRTLVWRDAARQTQLICCSSAERPGLCGCRGSDFRPAAERKLALTRRSSATRQPSPVGGVQCRWTSAADRFV